MKVDQMLSCFDYIEYKKVRMVTYEFTGYALFSKEIREGRRRHVDKLANLKGEMRTRFIPISYARDLRCLASIKTYPNTSSNWSPKKGSLLPLDQKEEEKLPNSVPASKNSSIKCFKYLGKGQIALHFPNKRSMIMKEDGTVDSESSKSKSSSISESDVSYEYSPNEKGQLCSIIIDEFASLMVLYDIAPMEATHVLLGSPWQYDCKVTYDEVTNKFMFIYGGHKVILKPQSSKEVNQYQSKMKLIREKKREKREKKSEKRMKDEVSKGTMNPKDGVLRKDTLQNAKGKEGIYVSKGGVKKILVAKKEPLYLLPTNMCFHLSTQLFDLPTGFTKRLEGFQGILPKEILSYQ
ncbi:hypothetical protein CR513_15424, partial [Mucuna pruriens]